jgi:VWFA-related protein
MSSCSGRSRLGVVTVAVALCASAAICVTVASELPQKPANQQNQPPTFRARVDLVEIDFVATDASGRPVLDLQRDELQVLEDGEPREVASLALVNLPLAEPHTPYAQDVATNEATNDSRLFFLILDDVHTLRERTDSVKAVARRFVERLSPGDQLAVAWVSLGNAGAREFTPNHSEVLAAIDRFSATDTRAARLNPNVTALPGLPLEAAALGLDALNVQGVFDRSRPFQLVIDVASYLASLPHRRKAIVFVGTGPSGMKVVDDFDGPPSRDVLDFTRAVTAARRANVAVYLLDPAKELLADVPVRPRQIPAEAVNANPFDRRAIQDLANAGHANGISMLSIATGGFDSAGPGVLSAVENVISDSGTYYLLGYYADPPSGRPIEKLKALFDPSSGFRSIEVRTTRPGLTIRARKGYWASDTPKTAGDKPGPHKPGDAADVSVTGVLPQSALALRAFVAPLRGKTPAKPAVALVVETTLPSLAPATLGLPVGDDIEMVVAAVAPGEGVRATDRAKVRLNVGESAGGGLVSPRYRLCSVVAVAPGRYQVRVGVQSSLAGKAGSVYADVTVPDFARDPLSLGGVFLERRPPGPPLPTVRTKTFAALVPFEATLDRDFASDDNVWVRVRAYGGKGTAGPILLHALVTRPPDGMTVWTADKRESADALRDQDGVEYVVQLPLSVLSPGAYWLRLTVEGQGAKSEARRIDFSVHAALPPVGAAAARVSRPLPAAAVSAVLDAAGRYAEDYFQRLAAAVGEELYEQTVESDSIGPFSHAQRTTRSDFLLVRLPGQPGLTPFRDVFEVDGQPVRDRNDRLEKLFLRDPVLALDTAQRVLEEGARYNIGRVRRNINHPVLPLTFLLPENRTRFAYAFHGEDTIDGRSVVGIDYVETARPTIIGSGRDDDRERPASGCLWIESGSGRILITTLKTGDRAFSMEATVVYRVSQELGILVPVEMREFYRQWLDSTRRKAERITCRATYQNFRRFKVTTDERISVPKSP